MLFRLEINDGSSGGRTSSLPLPSSPSSSSYALHPNVPTIVGRDSSIAHIPIQDNSVSRKHAIVTVVVVSVDASSSSASGKVGKNIFLDVVDCGSKLGTRVSAVSLLDGGGREEEDDDEEKMKLERVEAGMTRRVPLSPESSTTKITTSEEKKKKREGWRRAWLLKFGKISATVRCIEEENEATKKNGLGAADENKEEEGEATESDDDDDEKDEKNGNGSGDDDGDEGVGWKRPKTKREQKKMDRNNRGQVNVDREEVEVETVVDASLFRERIISPSQSSPPPRLFSANEQEKNDENRLGRVGVSNAKNRNVNNVNTDNKKRFQKQSIKINGTLTSAGNDVTKNQAESHSKLKIKKQKVPWPYETDGYETLAQFETALDREEKAAQRLKEKIAEELFEDPSVNAASLKKRGGKTSANGNRRKRS